MAALPSLQLHLLGELQVLRAGVPVELPPSKKARALCAYLVATKRGHRRERLADMLWQAGDDRRGGLRWSLSRLRPVLDEPELKRLVSHAEELEFRAGNAWVDVTVLGAALAGDLSARSAAELEQLLALFRGPFLAGLDQPELHEFQSWCLAERERWRRAHLQLLCAVLKQLAQQPEQALPHARELTRLAPDEAPSWCALLQLLHAAGHRVEAEEHFRLALRQLQEQGPLPQHELRSAWRALQPDAAEAPPQPPPAASPSSTPAHASTSSAPPRPFASAAPREPALKQRVQFCRAQDGLRLAYATMGSGPPLIKTANWMNHLEYDWKSPIWQPLASELTQRYTLVRYDQRGNGLSDWQVPEFSFTAFVSDLEAVVFATGLQRFSLLGISQGCAVAVEYAARYPERVDKLVLFGGYARGWRQRSPEEVEAREAMLTLIRRGWGKDNPAFRQLFSSLFMPEASAEQFQQFNELQRVSCSPENAARIVEAASAIDVTDRLELVRAPTLVLHCTEDARVPFAAGRGLAAGIPGARFVALESKNHLLLSHEPAWPRFLTEVQEFLAGD